ncbi:MAG TPA: class II aldolase/adducin family protein [Acidimicrobiales bacterium]
MEAAPTVDLVAEVLRVAQSLTPSGLTVGAAGNVSGRAADGSIVATPTAVAYDRLRSADLARVGRDGTLLSGLPPTTELALHQACYRRFADIGGVVHAHPVHASMFAVAGEAIPPAVEEAVLHLGGAIRLVPYHLTGSDALAAAVADALGDRSAVLLANHGLVCIGASPTDALHAALVAEQAAQIVWGARLLGPVQPIPPAAVAELSDRYRSARATWPRWSDPRP